MSGSPARTSPKDFFLHLLAIVLLYVSVGAFLSLVFSYINIQLPDALSYGYERTAEFASIRWTTAILIVVFPVHILCMWLLYRDMKQEPEKAELRVRKWLLYFTLFLAALLQIGDLIALIYNFLNGEITMRFLLKVVAVLAVAGAVFGYELWDLRRTNFQSASTPKRVTGAVAAVVLAVVVGGFFAAGSPMHQRKVRFDERRVNDLQTIQGQVVNHYQFKRKLPLMPSELTDDISGFSVPVDPDTGKSYEYRVTGTLKFQLCASFETASDGTNGTPRMPAPYGDSYGQNWAHGTGRACFDRTVDPEFYPPRTTEKDGVVFPG